MDIKDFPPNNAYGQTEYLRIHKKYLYTEFRNIYQLHNKIHFDDFVFCKVKKGLYGLKQAAILAYKLLVKQLAEGGYK